MVLYKVNEVGIGIVGDLVFFSLFACPAVVPDIVTLKTVVNLALRADVVRALVLLDEEHVVTVSVRALSHAWY